MSSRGREQSPGRGWDWQLGPGSISTLGFLEPPAGKKNKTKPNPPPRRDVFSPPIRPYISLSSVHVSVRHPPTLLSPPPYLMVASLACREEGSQGGKQTSRGGVTQLDECLWDAPGTQGESRQGGDISAGS